MRWLGLVLLLVIAACHRATPTPSGASLTFARDGKTVVTLTLAELVAAVPPQTVSVFDPYYGKNKRFRALPLAGVLARGFGADAGLAREEFVFRARDGFAVPMRGARVTEPGAYLAFQDLDVPGWEPIGPRKVDPAPFYLIWTKPGQTDLVAYPRPWQLETIEIARFEAIYPHTSPGPSATPLARRGYDIFRDQCIECHAINREGGRVGPDLNVPQNVTEYRPEAQIRAYIKDPATFRYGIMPAHPGLTEGDLDALIAYLRAMKDRKHDVK